MPINCVFACFALLQVELVLTIIPMPPTPWSCFLIPFIYSICLPGNQSTKYRYPLLQCRYHLLPCTLFIDNIYVGKLCYSLWRLQADLGPYSLIVLTSDLTQDLAWTPTESHLRLGSGPSQVVFTNENLRDSVKSRRKSWRKSHIASFLGLCDVLSFKVNGNNCDVISNPQ